jgi:hypothetical protein
MYECIVYIYVCYYNVTFISLLVLVHKCFVFFYICEGDPVAVVLFNIAVLSELLATYSVLYVLVVLPCGVWWGIVLFGLVVTLCFHGCEYFL